MEYEKARSENWVEETESNIKIERKEFRKEGKVTRKQERKEKGR
jgi:hypothetical protein